MRQRKSKEPPADKTDTTDITDLDRGRALLAAAEATGTLPPDPFPPWVDESGWGEMPDPRPLTVAVALARVLAENDPDPVALIRHSRRIVENFDITHEMKQAERPATAKSTIDELHSLEKALKKVVSLIKNLRGPARTVLAYNGYYATHLQSLEGQAEELKFRIELAVHDVPESASEWLANYGEAAGRLLDIPQAEGRPPATQAEAVTEQTAIAYEMLSGQKPTFTTFPLAKPRAYIGGPWPNTLKAVFQALDMSDSAEAQCRALAERRNAKREKPG